MKCAWEPLLAVLPPGIRERTREANQSRLREIRMRKNGQLEWNMGSDVLFSDFVVRQEDISFVINAASRYSPWTVRTMDKGYITIEGGHRIGLGGQVGNEKGREGLRQVESLCIRVAKDIPGAAKAYETIPGSTLIIGAPGWGKTTLLRDLARNRAEKHTTAVIDERSELFPLGFARGKRMDVLSGCSKSRGIEMALRTLGPEQIAVDEITAREDCEALIHAANCGVTLLATAHAASREDLYSRDVYRHLMERKVFQNLLVIRKDQSSYMERVSQ